MGASLSKKAFAQAGTAQDDAIEILDSDDESVDNNNIGTASGDNALESSSLEKAAEDDTSQQGKTHSDEQEEEYLKSALSKKNSIVIFSKEKPVARLPLPDTVKVPSRKRTVVFQPDVKCGSVTFSSSLQEDKQCRKITFHEGYSNAPDQCSILHGPDLDKIYDRYTSWDPYWEVVQDLSLGSIHGYDVGYKTTRIVSSSVTTTNCPPLSAVEFQFNIPPSIAASLKKSPFQKQYKERRLILRSLPIIIPEKYKKARSDTHLWPKGTFVQLNNVPILIVQRRQQSHDHMLWKGLSHMLDLTQAISNYEVKQKLTICTKDADSYNFQLVLCEYIPPNVIFDRCVGEGPLALTKLTFEEGRALIQQNFDEKNAVVLDDSDGESETPIDKSKISLTISLLCGASMSAIQVPVRGKKCKHMQCFDLKNYLLSNSNVSGGRWRCLVCEDFVPVRDLIIDGFMGKILEEHGKDVSTSRDKVEIHRNGTWKFLPENKLRYNKKRPCPSDQPDSTKRSKHKNSGPPITEIIDIIDD
jgi:MIZ/SP-RING zinc finger.